METKRCVLVPGHLHRIVRGVDGHRAQLMEKVQEVRYSEPVVKAVDQVKEKARVAQRELESQLRKLR